MTNTPPGENHAGAKPDIAARARKDGSDKDRTLVDLLLSGPKIDNVDEIWPPRDQETAEGYRAAAGERESASRLDRLSRIDQLRLLAVAIFAIAIGVALGNILADIVRLKFLGGLLG